MSQKQDSNTAGDPDYFEQLRKLQEQQSTGWGRRDCWPTYPQPQPCPNCGSCPTCGRRGHYTITYGYPGYVYL